MADKLVQDFVCDYYNDDVVFDGNDSDSIDALYVKQKRQAGVNLDNGLFANKPIESSSVGNFFKSAIASPVGLVATAGNNLAIIGQNVYDSLGERFKFLTEDELKRNKQIVENLNIQNQEIAENISEFFGADLDRISGKIGSGVGQSLSSLGFNAMGASPLMIALFGVNTAGENMAQARESGRSATESVGRGGLAGYFEAKLENWGLQNLVKNITHNTVLKSMANSFKTEFIEEMSQNLSTDLIMKDITKKDWTSIITDALEAGVYGGISGGITGGAGTSINRLANTNLKKQIIDGIQEKAGRKLNKQELLAVDKVVNRADIKFDDAVKSATDSLNNDEEMRQAIIDTLNEQSDRLKYGNDFNYSNVTTRAKEIMEEIIAGKRQVEETRHNAVVDLVDRNTNLSQEDKDLTVAMLEANFLANEEIFGDSFEEQLESKKGRFAIQTEAEPMDRLAFEDNENTYVNEAGELVDRTTGQVLFQQEQEDRDLVVLHSLSESNLNKVLDIGGLISPSLAIKKKGEDFNFELAGNEGLILVGNKNIIDPSLSSANEIFDRDVWTAMFPSKTYYSPKTKAIVDFENKLSSYRINSMDSFDDGIYYLNRNMDVKTAFDKLQDSLALKNYYIKEILKKDIKPVMVESYHQGIYADLPAVQKIEKLNKDLYNYDDVKKEFTDIAKEQIDRKASKRPQYKEQIKQNLLKSAVGEDGYITPYYYNQMVNDFHTYQNTYGKQEVDNYATKQKFNEMLGDNYNNWSEKFLEDNLFGSPQVKIGNKLAPYTKENILESMTKGETKNREQTMLGGGSFNEIMAAAGKQFYSIDEIKEMSKNLVSVEENIKIKESLKTKLNDIVSKYTDDFDKKLEIYKAIQNVASMKNPTIKSIENNIDKLIDIKEINASDKILNETLDFIKDIKDIETNYFEAKPQRIVDLKEFNAAIIPTDPKFNTIASRVEENGLKVVRSDNQQQALNTIDETTPIFFQEESQNIRGQIDTAKNLINIFKSGDKDTLIHELNHMFSLDRINLAISKNRLDTLNPLFKHFGLEATMENAEKLKETYYQEEIATMAVNYFTRNEAPTTGLRKYFQNLKDWAMSVWENLTSKGLVKQEELSPDVVEFFDSLYSTKEIDVESVAKAREELRQLIKDIKAGKAVNIENVNLDEVYRLLDAKNRRIPRAPKNLRQALVSAGGISNTLAESLDLKELMGEQDKKYSRLFTDNGKIKNENQLVEFLKSNGFMTSEEAQTDTQVGNEFDRAMNLLENAEDVYSEKDAQALAMRENTLQAVEEANQLLDSLGVDAEEVMQQIQELKKSDITAVSKSEVKQLDNKIKELEKEYKKLNKEVIKSTKENMQEMRDKVVDFIRAQKIDSEDKAKLITKVKQANTEYMLDKTLNEITEKAKEYYEKEQKNILSNAIEKELKKTKAKDVKNQKYLYEDNKLFNNLRNYSKMNQEQAEIELSKFMGKEDLTYDEQLEKLYLSYKANGKDDTSVDLMNELLDTIKYTKLQSKQAKDEKEFLDYLNRKENKDEMIHGVRTRKVTGGFEKGVARFVNGLNSMLRFVAGKDVAEKYNFENLETQKNIKTFNFYEAQAKESMDIFGFKKMGDLLNKIQEMRKKVATLSYYDEKLGQGKYDLTKMDIIDLYNDYKNADTKRAMDNIYGEAQIRELIDILTDEEKEFGDSLQKYVNERYEETNKVFVKAYQTDLPKIENYWPRTSERTTNETDAFDTFKKPSETPSQLKERKKGNVIVKPMDAYSKFQNHIESSFYLTEMALPYKELSETINSMRVKNEITNKFDDKVYKDLKELVDNLSYSEYFAYRKKDLQSGMYDKILNNWVSAKIGGLAPTVFVKQLLSATNYATEMGYKNWAKGFIEGLANPKQTIKFMEQYVGDYLKQRYKTGYNDAMSRVKEDAGNTPKVIPANIKNGLSDAITWMTRTGDISAIIYGGYPRLKQLLNSGMSEEEAVKTWITETERAQQSRTMANQSRFQHNRTYRLISNFKNTPIQYMRKINDTIVGYMNGDISKDVATRTLFNYAVVQPVLLGLVTAMMYNITAPDDKDKSYLDETIKALIMQFFNPVGGVSDVASAFVDTMQGNRVYDMQTPAFGEMVQAVKKLQKKKKDAFDYTEIMLPFIEATTGAPISRTEKQIKALVR